MAARGRRRTAWYGFTGSISGSAGTLETTITDSATVPSPATIIRVIGQLSITYSRSASPWAAGDTQGAHMICGLRTQQSALSAAAEDADFFAAGVLGDERWMWTASRRWVAEIHHFPLFTSAGVLTGYAYSLNTTGPSVVEIPIDVRAKRRWEDPSKLTLHYSWVAIGGGASPTAGDLRYAIRVLYALH